LTCLDIIETRATPGASRTSSSNRRAWMYVLDTTVASELRKPEAPVLEMEIQC
jgi:hypothetical protein